MLNYIWAFMIIIGVVYGAADRKSTRLNSSHRL